MPVEALYVDPLREGDIGGSHFSMRVERAYWGGHAAGDELLLEIEATQPFGPPSGADAFSMTETRELVRSVCDDPSRRFLLMLRNAWANEEAEKVGFADGPLPRVFIRRPAFGGIGRVTGDALEWLTPNLASVDGDERSVRRLTVASMPRPAEPYLRTLASLPETVLPLVAYKRMLLSPAVLSSGGVRFDEPPAQEARGLRSVRIANRPGLVFHVRPHQRVPTAIAPVAVALLEELQRTRPWTRPKQPEFGCTAPAYSLLLVTKDQRTSLAVPPRDEQVAVWGWERLDALRAALEPVSTSPAGAMLLKQLTGP
ncbi:MAG: hypothetical protein AAFZ65_20785 [Planctomycetota bacterium]